MEITRAAEDHLEDINRLIARSKAHWDWAPEYLAAALPLMVVTPAYLRENICLEVSVGEGVVGFVSVVEAPDRRLLDNLWIEPEHIGKGIGRFACEHLFDLARSRLWIDLTTLPDPPAEGFYRRMGFCDTGERVESRVPGGPVFSVFKREFDVPVRAGRPNDGRP